MILQKLTLHPFAGFSKKEIEFQPGFNIILGPNDVGKSTLFRAIESVLFLPTKLKANTIEGRELKRIIPIGGDSAQISLDFEVRGKSYSLKKRWGTQSECQITHFDHTVLTSPEKVEEKIRTLLPAPPGTFRSILMTEQNALDTTLRKLEENPEALHSLSDLLQTAFEQTDGISIDRLKSILGQQIEETFLNWEPLTRIPKKNRGIENPWDRQGPILRSFYLKEQLRKKLVETQALEKELGDKLHFLNEKLTLQTEWKKFIHENESRVEAMSTRQTLSLHLEQIENQIRLIENDLNRWMQAEFDRKNLEPEIQRLTQLIENYKQELKQARLEINSKNLLERFEKIEEISKKRDQIQKDLENIPTVRPEDIAELRSRWTSIEKAKASLSAAKLQLCFVSKAPMGVLVKRDVEPEKKEFLQEGHSLVIQAGGKIKLESEFFDLAITSGDGSMEKLESELKEHSEALKKRFIQFSVKSFEEAQEKNKKWNAATEALRTAESTLLALLGGEKQEDIRLKIQFLQKTGISRNPELIENDYAMVHAQLATRKSEYNARSQLIQELQSRYQLREASNLTAIRIKKGVEQETLKSQINALPLIPEFMTDPDQTVSQFKKIQKSLPSLMEEIRHLSEHIVEIKSRMPEQSAQDFERQYRESGSAFDQEIKKGEALLRVDQAIKNIEKNESDIYFELRKNFEKSVHQLSNGKYAKAQMKESIPTAFFRKDGVNIPYSWLSAGTQDSFALSLRLAISHYFLQSSKGFLLMDDPLVCMDPDRQKHAAELLKSCANHCQLILFTCHPSHAELLGSTSEQANVIFL